MHGLIYLACGLILLATELHAVWNDKRGDTLSEYVWAFLGRNRTLNVWQSIRRVVFIAFWGWLTLHFLFQWA